MAIHGMNHFNVLTDRLEESRAFYVGVLGFSEGPRPPLSFGGAWMYAGGGADPAHLRGEAARRPGRGARPPRVQRHRPRGTVARLKKHGIEFTLRQQVGTHIWQIFCNDPCGAKVELDFSPDETPPPGA